MCWCGDGQKHTIPFGCIDMCVPAQSCYGIIVHGDTISLKKTHTRAQTRARTHTVGEQRWPEAWLCGPLHRETV